MNDQRSPLTRTLWSTAAWYAHLPSLRWTVAALASFLLIGLGIEWGINQVNAAIAAQPHPTVTVSTVTKVTVTPSPTSSSKVDPSEQPTTTKPVQTRTHSASVRCTGDGPFTVNASGGGSGTVTTRISGPKSDSGIRSASATGGAGTYRISVADSQGDPHLSWNWRGNGKCS